MTEPAPPAIDGASPRRPLLALVAVVPAPSVGVLFAMYVMPGAVGAAVFFVCKVWLFALPALWWGMVDRGRLGLSPASRGGFGVAAVLGLLVGAAMLAAYAVVGHRWIDAELVRREAIENGIGTPARYLGVAAYWILVNSVLEEYVYRWFVFRQLEAVVGGRAAIAGSAACFTIHHVLALGAQFDWRVTVLASLGVFVGGAVWSWLYLRYRSIWPGYLSHAIVDIVVYVIGWRVIFG